MALEYRCCDTGFFISILVASLLVVFAGLMSGLTLGLMSMSLVDLEVLAKSGTPTDRQHASKILPVVRKQHLLLCTLLICNAAAMEALPIFLDSLVTAWGAILISVTLILLFGEVSSFSGQIYSFSLNGIASLWLLVLYTDLHIQTQRFSSICRSFPKLFVLDMVWQLVQNWLHLSEFLFGSVFQLLDFLLGKGNEPLFCRAELKTLVDLHGNEAGKGGELTRDETTIITGALELSAKKARDAMTPISETFAIDINAKLDRNLRKLILEKGHSRVPVYYQRPTNIIGLVLVKNLLTIHPENEVPMKNVPIRRIPRVSEAMPLYDILNEFQKGHSHMAVVIRHQGETEQPAGEHSTVDTDVRVDIDGESHLKDKCLKTKRSLKKSSFSHDPNLHRGASKSKKWTNPEVLHITDDPLPVTTGEGEAIGIITLEDVIEELLQEEIYDETDYQAENN